MGYSAVDCKGVSLTPSVRVTNNINIWTAGLYTVTYEVADSVSPSLTARATRTVTVKPKPPEPPPKTAPTITIIGSNPIVLHRDSATLYTEQRARAIDHDGTNISHLVTVTGSVNRKVAGTYTLTYRVTSPDSGLTSATTRNVRILAPNEKREPRTTYGLEGQAKQGARVTHTGIVSGGSGFIDVKATSVSNNMTITVQLVDTASKRAVLTDTFTAAGTKQYRIDAGKYDLNVDITKANGNAKYTLQLTMPEPAPTYFYDSVEVPLPGLPQIAPRGSNPIILHIGGTTYLEQGARAVDRFGNDISDKVTVDGEPDTGVAGKYTITYTVVCDITGIPVKATRDVLICDPSDSATILPGEVPLDETPVTVTPGTITYTVAPGDSLWKIAQKHFGTGTRWGEIFEMNREVIGANPSLLRIGQVLTIRLE